MTYLKITLPFSLLLLAIMGQMENIFPNQLQQNKPSYTASANEIPSDSLAPLSPFCGQAAIWNNALQNSPELFQKHQDWEKQMEKGFTENRRLNINSLATPYTLPIVIHIVHENGPENIPLAQVLQGVQDLNDAFANVGYYDPNDGEDTQIQFCLAIQDPQKLPTDGINRIVSPLTNINKNEDDVLLKNLSRWDPTQYINIWLVNEICSGTSCGVAGYAFLPSAHGMDVDGIVMEARWFGSSEGNSSITVHEMGHYLGLYHTFQGGCDNSDCLVNGDRVCDTPPDQSTAAAPCDATVNSCSTDVNPADTNNPFTSDQNDLIRNYMDYGDRFCYTIFTAGQSARMHNAIETQRSSLLDSKACESPCPFPITASFTASNTMVEIGSTVTFTNTSTGATNYNWTIDQVPFPGTPYTFNTEGTFEVVLTASTGDPRCIDTFAIEIEVFCPVQASFDVPSWNVQLGSPVDFTNTSSNATNIIWTINNIPDGTGNIYTVNPPTTGIFSVCLIASNGFCQSTRCQQVIVTDGTPGSEICDNGFDDDGDGLIDCYDPDCCQNQSCATNYYVDCPIDPCDSSTFISGSIELELEWKTSSSSVLRPLGFDVTVGDVDGDGFPEFFQGRYSPGRLAMCRGTDGSVIWELTSGVEKINRTLIADVDRDGTAEIFTTGGDRLRRIEHDGTITENVFVPNEDGSFYQARACIADFNQDGKPEIFHMNHLFDTDNLSILSSLNFTEFNQYKDYGLGVPVDVLPQSAACPDCDGLELVLGPFLYAVNNTTFEFTKVHDVMIDGVYSRDNTTSIADMDGDGDLDAVVRGRTTFNEFQLYIWDIQTPTILADITDGGQTFPFNAFNFPAVADLNGNGNPEVVFRNQDDMVAYNNDLSTELWRTPITETGGNASHSLFDINDDGIVEVIYRDSRFLRIIDGSDGTELDNIECRSATNAEMPVIVDIDSDGEAEIVCECLNRINVFGSAGMPWANTRQVWNQFLNFNVHINDDLTVPIVQQEHHLVGDGVIMNAFSKVIVVRERFDCVEICDNGLDDDMDGLIDCEDPDCCDDAFCDMQPTPCDTFCVFVGSLDLGPDLIICDTASFTFDAGDGFSTYLWHDLSTNPTYNSTGPGKVWVMTTDSCGNTYSDTVMIRNIPLLGGIDLGPDREICDNGILNFDAGDGYSSYLWSDFSTEQTFTSSGTGKIWVAVTDSCGRIYSDTVLISLILDTRVDLGPDLNLCQGDSILLAGGTFDQYQWFINQTLLCDTCPELWVKPDTTTTYILLAGSNAGCFSLDSITISIDSITEILDTLYLCEGDTISLFGQNVFDTITLSQTVSTPNICDSLFTTKVLLLDSIHTFETVSLCQGDSFLLATETYYQDTTLLQLLTASNTCDSLHHIQLVFEDNIFTPLDYSICEGDSILLLGQYYFDAVTLWDTVAVANACDSVFQISLSRIDTAMSFEQIEICNGDSIVIDNQSYFTDTTIVQVFSSVLNCDSTHVIDIHFIDLIHTQETIELCEGDTILVYGQSVFAPTILQDTQTATNTCDSTHTIIVTQLDSIHTFENISLCDGDSVLINGQFFFQDTLLIQMLSGANTCDSIHHIQLLFDENIFASVNHESCEGDSILVLGQYYFDDQILFDTISAPNGCDSIFQINITFNDTAFTQELIELCDGDTIVIDNQEYTANAIVVQELSGVRACDSTHITTLNFKPTIATSEQIDLCAGDTIVLFGQAVFAAGIYQQTQPGANNCDSTHTVTVQLYDPIFTFENIDTCLGTTVIVFGQMVDSDTILTQQYLSSDACDSIHQITVSFQNQVVESDTAHLCEEEYVVFFGDTLRNAGLYENQNNPLGGPCDTLQQLFINVQEATLLNTIIQPPCPEEDNGQMTIDNPLAEWTYSIDGQQFQSSPFFEALPAGAYSLWAQDEFGCIHESNFTVPPANRSDVILPSDTTIYPGDTILMPIQYADTSGLQFEWNPAEDLSCKDCPYPLIFPEQSQNIKVKITDAFNCVFEVRITVLLDNSNGVYIPSGFSPNGDQINDRFTIFSNSDVEQIDWIRIYDRWGAEVYAARNFLANDPTIGWDGAMNGEPFNPGVYVYQCQIRKRNGRILQLSGDITLTR